MKFQFAKSSFTGNGRGAASPESSYGFSSFPLLVTILGIPFPISHPVASGGNHEFYPS